MKIEYADGSVVNASDFADALGSVRRNHPVAVAYQDGSEVDGDDDVAGGWAYPDLVRRGEQRQ